MGSGVSFPSTYQAGNVAITGGAINGVTIGATTPGTIAATSIAATGSITGANATTTGNIQALNLTATAGVYTGSVAATGGISGATIGASGTVSGVDLTASNSVVAAYYNLNSRLLFYFGTPSVSACGASGSIIAGNGTTNFRVNIGSSSITNACTINFPAAASTGWACSMTLVGAYAPLMTISTYTTLTLTIFSNAAFAANQ